MLKQVSKKILILSKNNCKAELSRFPDLISNPGSNGIPPKGIYDVHKQKTNIFIFLVHPSAVIACNVHVCD